MSLGSVGEVGSQGRSSASTTRTSKNWLPCRGSVCRTGEPSVFLFDIRNGCADEN